MTGLMPKHATQWACFVYFNSSDHRCTSVKGGDCWLWVTGVTFLGASRSLCLAGNAGDWFRWGWVYELSLFNFYVHRIVIFFFFFFLPLFCVFGHHSPTLIGVFDSAGKLMQYILERVYQWFFQSTSCCGAVGVWADHRMSAFRQMKPMVEGW